jgi:transcriptional regulator with XRE-family HTH domain
MAKHHPKKGRAPKFGALLASAAAREGITQAELARRLGITQHRVSQIFHAECITEALLRRCAHALGMRLDVKLTKERRAA